MHLSACCHKNANNVGRFTIFPGAILNILCAVAEKKPLQVHIQWMVKKIRLDEIYVIICTGIPDPETDPEFYEVVTTNLIHGPCGNYNQELLCIIENKCFKFYPHSFLADTITGNDGNLLLVSSSTCRG